MIPFFLNSEIEQGGDFVSRGFGFYVFCEIVSLGGCK